MLPTFPVLTERNWWSVLGDDQTQPTSSKAVGTPENASPWDRRETSAAPGCFRL